VQLKILGSCPDYFEAGIGPVGMFIETDSHVSLLVDCGMGHVGNPDIGYKPVTFLPLEIERLDYVLLSHIHIDHSGLVSWVMKKYPEAKLITTVPTLALGNAVWNDHQRLASRYGYPGLVPFGTGLYGEICKRTIPVSEHGWLELKNGVRVYFNANGHSRGSAYIALEADGKRVVFSGDVSLDDTPTILGMRRENIPEEIRGADILFLESTYGARTLKPRPSAIALMNRAIVDTLRGGGKVLATALSVERTQDIALDQVKAGISPVYIDGALAASVWEIYQRSESYWSPNDVLLDPNEVEQIKRLLDYGNGFRTKMLENEETYSIVASPGSLQGGYSAIWAKRILPDPRSLLLQCNYQFEGTPGAELERFGSGMRLELGGEFIEVNSRVMRVDVSAHADRFQLAKVASWFLPKQIVLYHGTSFARQRLRELLETERFRVKTPLNSDEITL